MQDDAAAVTACRVVAVSAHLFRLTSAYDSALSSSVIVVVVVVVVVERQRHGVAQRRQLGASGCRKFRQH